MLEMEAETFVASDEPVALFAAHVPFLPLAIFPEAGTAEVVAVVTVLVVIRFVAGNTVVSAE